MKTSAGIVLYRFNPDLELFICHPGGPLYAHKNDGYWGFPKGGVEKSDISLLHTAVREFQEETGMTLPLHGYTSLGEVHTKAKRNHFWALEGNFTGELKSNLVTGRFGTFPELDRAEWHNIESSLVKVRPIYIEIINRLVKLIGR